MAKKPRYRVAYGSVPKDGGTFTFYRNLRPRLAELGIDLLCVTVGNKESELIQGEFIDDGCVFLAEDSNDVKQQARAFVHWCSEAQVDIVMAINSIAILSALPHLPQHIRVVARCANAFDEGYRVTMSGRDRLARVVALTPRLRDDLIADYAAKPDTITLIPNGIDPEPYDRLSENTATEPAPGPAPIELGFLGRLEHRQKGVLHLPAIISELQQRNIRFRLRIAGKGKHEAELQKRLRPLVATGEVVFCGALSADEVPDFLHSLDAFLFTSHFEGCPNALLEAMMAGAAPVAFQIEGIVDFILERGKTGLIAPNGDCATFAGHVATLAQNRETCSALGSAAAAAARERFVPAIAAQAYARMFEEVMVARPPEYPPLGWEQFAIDTVYDPGWKALVPQPLKSLLRRFLG